MKQLFPDMLSVKVDQTMSLGVAKADMVVDMYSAIRTHFGRLPSVITAIVISMQTCSDFVHSYLI